MKSLLNKNVSKTSDILRFSKNLSCNDPFYVQKSLLRSLLVDISRFLPGTRGLERDIVTLEARIEHEGTSFLAVALSSLGKALDRGLSDGRFTIPDGFKTAKGKKIPLLFGGIFCKVFDETTGELESEVAITLEVSLLRQLLYFLEEVYSGYGFGPKARSESESRLREMRL